MAAGTAAAAPREWVKVRAYSAPGVFQEHQLDHQGDGVYYNNDGGEWTLSTSGGYNHTLSGAGRSAAVYNVAEDYVGDLPDVSGDLDSARIVEWAAAPPKVIYISNVGTKSDDNLPSYPNKMPSFAFRVHDWQYTFTDADITEWGSASGWSYIQATHGFNPAQEVAIPATGRIRVGCNGQYFWVPVECLADGATYLFYVDSDDPDDELRVSRVGGSYFTVYADQSNTCNGDPPSDPPSDPDQTPDPPGDDDDDDGPPDPPDPDEPEDPEAPPTDPDLPETGLQCIDDVIDYVQEALGLDAFLGDQGIAREVHVWVFTLPLSSVSSGLQDLNVEISSDFANSVFSEHLDGLRGWIRLLFQICAVWMFIRSIFATLRSW